MADPLPTIASGVWEWETFDPGIFRDPTVRSETSDGRPLTRSGTGPILRTWRFTRRNITTADLETWDTWQRDTVKIGGESWTWTDPRPGGTTYTVRLAEPIRFLPRARTVGRHDAFVYLIEEPT